MRDEEIKLLQCRENLRFYIRKRRYCEREFKNKYLHTIRNIELKLNSIVEKYFFTDIEVRKSHTNIRSKYTQEIYNE